MGCQSNDCIKYVTIIVTFLAVVVALFICGIQYITAFVTFLAVVVALFKDEIKNMIWRPDADIEIDYDSIDFINDKKTILFLRVLNRTKKLKQPIKDTKIYITKVFDITDEQSHVQLVSIPTPLPFWDFSSMGSIKEQIDANINSFAFIKLFEFVGPKYIGTCKSTTETITIYPNCKIKIEFLIVASNFLSKKISYTFHWIGGTPFDSKVFKENIKICREDVNE